MPAFGENLRREREMRGVSLEEISSATKISLRFLDAIEREDFSKLPGGIFSRSFIRSYARYLGLDEERVVAEFQLAAQPQTDFDLHRMAAGNATAGRPASRTPLIATLVAVVLLAGAMCFSATRARAAEAPASAAPAGGDAQAGGPSARIRPHGFRRCHGGPRRESCRGRRWRQARPPARPRPTPGAAPNSTRRDRRPV